MRRIAILLLVAATLFSVAVPAGIAAASASPADGQGNAAFSIQEGEEPPENDTENGDTEEEDDSTDPRDAAESFFDDGEDDSSPTSASQVRVTPIQEDEDWLEITVRESDESYDTRGPHALFEVSEKVSAVRIEQPNADATVLGDYVVRVDYEDGAGEGDQESLYQLELFFEDDSEHTIDLYATDTDVSVEAARYTEYAPFIDYVEGQADDAGFDTDPEGLQSYVERQEEIANILDTFLGDHAQRFASTLLLLAFNPVTYILGIGGIAGIMLYWIRKHGWVLSLLDRARSEAELIRESIQQQHERDKRAAASHSLREVDEIGPNAARYWRQLDVETIDHMIQIACKGLVALDENGKIVRSGDGSPVLQHRGIDDLLAVDPLTEEQLRSNTWLNPVLLEGRLTGRTALSNIRQALLVAETEYNRGPEVREYRNKVEYLLDELQGENDIPTPNDSPAQPTQSYSEGDD